MTSELQEAVELTVGGLATVFLLLIFLVILLVMLRWFVAWGPVSRLIAELSPPGADPAQRDKALASAIGVTIALAESGRAGREQTVEEASA